MYPKSNFEKSILMRFFPNNFLVFLNGSRNKFYYYTYLKCYLNAKQESLIFKISDIIYQHVITRLEKITFYVITITTKLDHSVILQKIMRKYNVTTLRQILKYVILLSNLKMFAYLSSRNLYI